MEKNIEGFTGTGLFLPHICFREDGRRRFGRFGVFMTHRDVFKGGVRFKGSLPSPQFQCA